MERQPEGRPAGYGWDFCAVGLSSLCVVHCLGLPFAAALLPIMSQVMDAHAFHVAMVALAAPVTLYVVAVESRARRHETFIVLALLGLSLMVTAVAVPPLERFETALTVSGGTLLAGAHVWRWQKRRNLHATTQI